jgi:hypothetical protein
MKGYTWGLLIGIFFTYSMFLSKIELKWDPENLGRFIGLFLTLWAFSHLFRFIFIVFKIAFCKIKNLIFTRKLLSSR